MQRETTTNARRPRAIGIATALMCALAGGAVWCLASLYSRGDLAGFAFLVAILIAWALRTHGYAGRWSGACIAAACVLLAAVYSFCLQAVAQIASLLGLSMRATLAQMDPGMALDIAWANLRGWNLVVVAAAALLSVGLMMRTNTKPGA
ncbi:MAG: hypothetical protein ACHP7D_07560 [Lysobacterales bacterium]